MLYFFRVLFVRRLRWFLLKGLFFVNFVSIALKNFEVILNSLQDHYL